MEENHAPLVQAFSFLTLPDELLLLILSFLNIHALVNFKKTSQRFNQLAQDETLWERQYHHIFREEVVAINHVSNAPKNWKEKFQNRYKFFPTRPPTSSPNTSPTKRALASLSTFNSRWTNDPTTKQLLLAAVMEDLTVIENIPAWELPHLKTFLANFRSSLQIALNKDSQFILDVFYQRCDKKTLSEDEQHELKISCRQYTLQEFKDAYEKCPRIFNHVINYGITKYLPTISAEDLPSTSDKALNALSTALISQHWSCVKALFARGVSINRKDAFGDTLLITSINYKRLPQVKFLLTNGADTTIKNDAGQTPKELATNTKNDAIINCFSNKRKHKRETESDPSNKRLKIRR